MGRRPIAIREAGALTREKTIVLAIVVQLLVAGFSSILFVGLVGLYDPGPGTPPVRVGVAGNASPSLTPVLRDGGGTDPVTYESQAAARAAFDRGRVDAMMYATVNRSGVVHVTAVAPDGAFRTTLVVVELRDALARLERSLRTRYGDRLVREPVAMPDPGSGSQLFSLAYTVLLPLLVLLPVFIGGSIAVDSLAEELERGTVELLRVSPVSPNAIFDGKALAAIGSAPIQAAAWIALLHLNDTPVGYPLTLLVVVTAYTTVAVGVGLVLAAAVPRRRDAQLLYSLAILIVLAVATLTPASPVNVIAKLGIASPTPGTWAAVAGSVLAAGLAYGVARITVVQTLTRS